MAVLLCQPINLRQPITLCFPRVIDPGAKANLMVYDMKADGIDYSEIVRKGSHGAILPDCRLYINGERQWLGRYPDNAKENGYVYFEDLDGCTYKDSAGV